MKIIKKLFKLIKGKDDFYSLKNNIKRAKENLKKHKKIIRLVKKIYSYNKKPVYEIIIYDFGLAIEPKGTDQFKICLKELRKIFPKFKLGEMYSVDSPCGYILVRYHTSMSNIKIWVNYENESDLPAGITNNGKCHFKKVTEEKEVFVCEKEGDK